MRCFMKPRPPNSDFPYFLITATRVPFATLCDFFGISCDEWEKEYRWHRSVSNSHHLYFKYEEDYLAAKLKFA